MIVVLYPLIYILSSSFSSAHAVVSGRVRLLPIEPNIEGYRRVFQNKQVLVGYQNSIINTIVGTIINLAITFGAAYPLSRRAMAGKKIVSTFFIITMLFSGGIIPTYIAVKSYGLIDTRWALLLPYAMIVYMMIVARTFFEQTIPEDLREAATIDGCSEFGVFFKIVLPLSKPIVAVLALLYAVRHWNSFFDAMIYINRPSLAPLQIVLRTILLQNSIDASLLADAATALQLEGMRDLLKNSLIVVASVPVLVVYPFIQKYFIRGILLGAVKG